MTKISIAIPTYVNDNIGLTHLQQLLMSIYHQSFKDVEIVISDHSIRYDVANLCENYFQFFNLIYVRNFYNRGTASANANSAMNHCSGNYIKIMHQDDFFVDVNALDKIVESLDLIPNRKWLINGFNHTRDGQNFFDVRIPTFPNHLLVGNNLIGSPSNVTIRNDSKLLFDTNMTMGIDHEWYHRLRFEYGMPIILKDTLTTSRIHDNRVSANVTYDIKIVEDGSDWMFIRSEFEYICKKHEEFVKHWRYPID